MKPYFECLDKLNKPYEAFLFDAQTSEMFPILPHWHYFVEILYMVEGKAYVEAGEENYVLEPGDLIVFYPQMAHAIYSTGQLPIRYYVLKFDPAHLNISGSALPSISSLIAMAAVEQKLSVYFSKEKFNQEKMKQLIQGSVKTLEEKQFGYDIIMHSNYCLLMAEILRVWKQEGFQIKKRKKETVLSEKLEYFLEENPTIAKAIFDGMEKEEQQAPQKPENQPPGVINTIDINSLLNDSNV